jgi:hypothetical protein
MCSGKVGMFFFVSDTRRIADWSKLVKSKSVVKNAREERQMVTKSWSFAKQISPNSRWHT